MKFTLWLLLLALVARPFVARAQSAAAPRSYAPEDGEPSDVWVHLERTAGIYRRDGEPNSPVYRVTVFGDGTVRYVGEGGVRVRGERRAKVPVRDVVACVNFAARQGFFEWSPTRTDGQPRLLLNRQGQPVLMIVGTVDSPGLAIQIGLDGEQTWRGGPLAPEWLRQIAKRIDQLVDSERWIK